MWWHRFIVFAILLSLFSPLYSLFAQDSLNVRRIASISSCDSYWDAVVNDTVAIVLNSTDVSFFDIRNPEGPVLLSIYAEHAVDCIAAAGAYVYAGCGDIWALRVIDIMDPSNPTEVGQCYIPVPIEGVAVAGRYAFTLDGGYGGIRVIDITNPTTPVPVGFCNLPAMSEDVAVSGSYAYVANYNYGLRIIDISDPAAPVEVGSYDTPGYASDVAVSGAHCYVVDHGGALRIISIEDPTEPTEVGVYYPPGEPSDVAVAGDHAFVGSDNGDLWVVSIADASKPFENGYYEMPDNWPGSSMGIAVAGGLAYVANSFSFDIYDCSVALPALMPSNALPTEFTLSAYPNPFNSVSTFLMDVPPGVKEVTISVFDLLGREVRREVKPVTSAHMIYRFDASSLSSGVYFARVETPDIQRTVKLMLLK